MNLARTAGLLFLLGLLSFTNAFNASAQKTTKYTIVGQIVDSTSRKGIEYATVALLGDSAKVLTAAAADASGKFTLETKLTGKLRLSASAIGFATTTTPLTVGGDKARIDAGTILLPVGVQIDEVTVTTQKPLIKTDAEKLVYSVEADPEAQTSTLADILRKVPQLSVDAEDNVRLNGQSNYKVLVNGKTSSLYSNNFKEVIKSMPASSIKDIQVITNPSAKYDAEGAAGIINIITSRKAPNGYSGRVGGNYSSFNSYNGNAFFAAQLGKLNFSANYWIGRFNNPETNNSSETNYFNPETGALTGRSLVSGQGKGDNLWQGLSVEASYEIDTSNLITLSLQRYDGSYENNFLSLTDYTDAQGNPIRKFSNRMDADYGWGGLSGSFDYQHTFRKPEHTFTFSYNLDTNPETTDTRTELDATLGSPSYTQRSHNKANGSEHTFQADYFNPVTKSHNIEAGMKYVLRINTSFSEAERLNEEQIWVPYDANLNDLDYTQHIVGVYGSYQYKREKFNIKAGARFEGTVNDGTSKMTGKPDTGFDNRQTNFIPYLNTGYQFTKSQSLSFSYTQRLHRPGIWHLNPYVDDSDPMNISHGNPDLKSVVNHSFSMDYSTFGGSWNLNLGAKAAFSNNTISQITTVNEQGVATTTYDNIGKEQRYTLNGSYSYRLKTKFNIYCNANANYTILEAPSRDLRNEGFNFGGQMGVGIGLWKDADLQLNGGVFSSRITLQGKSPLSYYTSAALIQKFFKKKLDFSFRISEPFTKYRTYNNQTTDPSFSRWSEFSMIARRFNISVGYRIGKTDTKVKKVSRSIDNDDKMGGGGGQGGGGGM